MKVILLSDIPKVGSKYEIKDVASGYARNFLLPKNMAEIATEKAIERIEKKKEEMEKEKKVQQELLLKDLEKLQKTKLTIAGKANDKGHLFAGISKEDISEALKKDAHIHASPDFIELEHPVKEVGTHKIPVKVGDKEASFELVVEAE